MKIGIISQARMTSTRLPGKVLKKVNHKPLLTYHINRIMKSGYPLFIATTQNQEDDPIIELAIKNNIPFLRGSEENVLERYYLCAKQNNLDVIVRVTSDCPLLDGHLIKDSIDQFIHEYDKYRYLSNCLIRTYPRGFDFEIFSFPMLEEAYYNAESTYEREHVTPYLQDNTNGRIKFAHVKYKNDASNFRITVDEEDDFRLIKILIEDYHADIKNADEIINILQSNPELHKINDHVMQKSH